MIPECLSVTDLLRHLQLHMGEGKKLTDEIASCSVGLGFLLAEDPKMRFMVGYVW